MVHSDEPQIVEEKFEVEVQESVEQIEAEDVTMHEDDVTCVELVMSIDECFIAAIVCDQSPDEVLAPIHDEIQSILTDAPSHEPSVFLDLMDPTHIQPDVYYEIFPLPTHYQETSSYYEIFPISNTFKRTRFHHNLIIEGYGL